MAHYDGGLVFNTKIDPEGFDEGLDNLNKKAKEGVEKTSHSLLSGTSKLKSIATVGLKAIGASIAAVATGLSAATVQGVKYNAQIEEYTTSFETMLGSAEHAQRMVNDLKSFANTTPFEMTDLAKNTQTLLSFGTAADDIMPTLQMLGDISQGNTDKMNSLTLAFAQMSSTGKLTGQDLLQMINAGFNPLNEMSKMTGKSVAQLKEEMSKGAISSEMVAEAFKHATKEGGQFYNAMQNQSKTFNGQLSNLKDNWSSFLGSVTNGITSELKNKALPMLNDFLTQAQEAFDKGGFAGLMNATGDILAQAVKKIISYAPKIIDASTKVIQSFVKGIRNNSETIISGAVELVTIFTGGIGDLLPDMISGVVDLLIDTLTSLLSDLPNLVQIGFNIVQGIVTGIATAIPKLLTGVIDLFKSLFTQPLGIADVAKYELTEAQSAMQETLTGIEESYNAHRENIAAIMSDSSVADAYISQLVELTAQESISAEEKEKILALVANLNELYPELNLQYDTETNTLNKTNDELQAYVENSKKAAQADALRARMQEIEKQKIQLIQEQKTLLADLNEAQQNFYAQSDLVHYLEEMQAAVHETQQVGEGLYSAFDYNRLLPYRDTLEELGFMFDDVNGTVSGTQDQITLLNDFFMQQQSILLTLHDGYVVSSDAVYNMNHAYQELTLEGDRLAQVLAGQITLEEAYGIAMQETAEVVGEAGAATSEANSDIISSSTDAGEALKAEQDAMQQWSLNIIDIASKTQNGFVLELQKIGPSAAEALQGMVDLSDEQMEHLQKAFDNGGLEAVNVFLSQLSKPTIPLEASTMISNAGEAMERNNSMGEAIQEQALASEKNLVGYRGSFQIAGGNLMEGVAQGVNNKAGVVNSAVSKVATKALATMKKQLGIASPSKVMRDVIGKNIVAGIGVGVELQAPETFGEIQATMLAEQNALADKLNAQQLTMTVPSITLSDSSSNAILALLSQYLPELANMQMVLDTGALVGNIAEPLDAEFGIMKIRKERGYA